MSIINYNLNFPLKLVKRSRNAIDKSCTKIYLCSENTNAINVGDMHNQMLKIGDGYPYHYTVFLNGGVAYCRPRIYCNGLCQGVSSTPFNNSVAVCVEGLDGHEIIQSQQTALVSLLTQLLIQEGLFVEDIVDLNTFLYNSGEFYNIDEIKSLVSVQIDLFDSLRNVSTPDLNVAYFKFIPPASISTLAQLSKYTKIPQTIISQMNPSIGIDGILPTDKTLFLPCGYFMYAKTAAINKSQSNAIYSCGKNKIAQYKQYKESFS